MEAVCQLTQLRRLTLHGECKAGEGVRLQLTQLQQLTYLRIPGMDTLESGPGALLTDEVGSGSQNV